MIGIQRLRGSCRRWWSGKGRASRAYPAGMPDEGRHATSECELHHVFRWFGLHLNVRHQHEPAATKQHSAILSDTQRTTTDTDGLHSFVPNCPGIARRRQVMITAWADDQRFGSDIAVTLYGQKIHDVVSFMISKERPGQLRQESARPFTPSATDRDDSNGRTDSKRGPQLARSSARCRIRRSERTNPPQLHRSRDPGSLPARPSTDQDQTR